MKLSKKVTFQSLKVENAVENDLMEVDLPQKRHLPHLEDRALKR